MYALSTAYVQTYETEENPHENKRSDLSWRKRQAPALYYDLSCPALRAGDETFSE